MENKFKDLLKYIGENMHTQSAFLYPQPSTVVEITGLLDKIAELREISKEQNGKEFNSILDNKELT